MGFIMRKFFGRPKNILNNSELSAVRIKHSLDEFKPCFAFLGRSVGSNNRGVPPKKVEELVWLSTKQDTERGVPTLIASVRATNRCD